MVYGKWFRDAKEQRRGAELSVSLWLAELSVSLWLLVFKENFLVSGFWFV